MFEVVGFAFVLVTLMGCYYWMGFWDYMLQIVVIFEILLFFMHF